MTASERLEAYLALGLDVFLGADGRLRLRGRRFLVDAAKPSIAQHRAALETQLSEFERAAEARVVRRRAIERTETSVQFRGCIVHATAFFARISCRTNWFRNFRSRPPVRG